MKKINMLLVLIGLLPFLINWDLTTINDNDEPRFEDTTGFILTRIHINFVNIKGIVNKCIGLNFESTNLKGKKNYFFNACDDKDLVFVYVREADYKFYELGFGDKYLYFQEKDIKRFSVKSKKVTYIGDIYVDIINNSGSYYAKMEIKDNYDESIKLFNENYPIYSKLYEPVKSIAQ